MRYMVESNFVQVIGKGWYGQGICYEYKLREYDVENIGEFTRENVQDWLDCNAGDFQVVDDFCATVGDYWIEWGDAENEGIYNDAVYGE